jgi:putative SOS response-associated peptidase YedK
MLITEPNDFVAEVHDRMPVVLESKDSASWLNEAAEIKGRQDWALFPSEILPV